MNTNVHSPASHNLIEKAVKKYRRGKRSIITLKITLKKTPAKSNFDKF